MYFLLILAFLFIKMDEMLQKMFCADEKLKFLLFQVSENMGLRNKKGKNRCTPHFYLNNSYNNALFE